MGGGYLHWLKILLKNTGMSHVNHGQVGPKSSIAKVFWQRSFNPETDGWCIYRPLFFEEKLQILLYGRLTPPFENLDLIDWKTDACWENNDWSDFLTKKLASKYSHDVRVFFISV